MICNFVCIVFLFVCLPCFTVADELKFASNNILEHENSRVLTNANAEVSTNKHLNLHAAICDCGHNSVGCKFIEEKKICDCNEGFAQGMDGICVEACNETQTCKNGGSCLQHFCVCLPGTQGPFCETIHDCLRNNMCVDNEDTDCSYDIDRQKAYCRCRIMEYRFDEATKTCRSCLCTPWDFQNLNSFSYCDYQHGRQVCVCTEGYSYNSRYEKCDSCDCGPNTTWCGFDNEGNRICGCKEGYYNAGYRCNKCNCGDHGLCDPKFVFPSCICDEGYADRNGICIECSCGKYGTCLYDEHSKQVGCKCEVGYAEKSGKCEKCYCGDNINCTFADDRKVCFCESGFEDANGFCKDIDECEKHNPCKESMTCINLIGSYECICKEGYKPLIIIETIIKPYVICQDSDECQNSSACAQPNTFCENTVGSFKCICKSGFVSRGVLGSSSLCEESTATSIYTTIGIVSFVSLIMTGTVVYYVKKTFQRSNPGFKQELK